MKDVFKEVFEKLNITTMEEFYDFVNNNPVHETAKEFLYYIEKIKESREKESREEKK